MTRTRPNLSRQRPATFAPGTNLTRGPRVAELAVRPQKAEARMGLFNWLRSKRPMRQPSPLPVRYGLGPPPPKPPPTPDDLCPLCGGEVSNVQWVGHFSTYDGLGGSLHRGRCSICDTMLHRGGLGVSPGWRASIPQPEQLRAAVPTEELEALTARFGRLDLFDRMWAEFLAARRPGDEVWQFANADGREGFAVVRQGRPLTEFLAPDPAFERRLLESAAKQAEPGAAPDPAA